jgi:hypothetical protein
MHVGFGIMKYRYEGMELISGTFTPAIVPIGEQHPSPSDKYIIRMLDIPKIDNMKVRWSEGSLIVFGVYLSNSSEFLVKWTGILKLNLRSFIFRVSDVTDNLIRILGLSILIV